MDSLAWLDPGTIISTVSVIVAFIGIWWKIDHDKRQRHYDRVRDFRLAQREAVVNYIAEVNEAYLKFSTELHRGFLMSEYVSDSRLPYSIVSDIDPLSFSKVSLSRDAIKGISSQYIALNNEFIRDIEDAYAKFYIGVYKSEIAKSGLILVEGIPRYDVNDLESFLFRLTSFKEDEVYILQRKNAMIIQLRADVLTYLSDLPEKMPSKIGRLFDWLLARIYCIRRRGLSIKAARKIRQKYCLLDARKQESIRSEFEERFASELKKPGSSPAEIEAQVTYEKVMELMDDLQPREIKRLDADFKRLQKET